MFESLGQPPLAFWHRLARTTYSTSFSYIRSPILRFKFLEFLSNSSKHHPQLQKESNLLHHEEACFGSHWSLWAIRLWGRMSRPLRLFLGSEAEIECLDMMGQFLRNEGTGGGQECWYIPWFPLPWMATCLSTAKNFTAHETNYWVLSS